ncbi:MAG: aspartate/tyrosine/aromatic aminotransferase [Rhizobiaceae bacterium]|nr:aspartate/tyrosine/aromatic aminotransferase [Rhizobiaceae bacterium]
MNMFEKAQPLVMDPIIYLMREYRADTRPQKINLGIGVYTSDQGITPIFTAVKKAEEKILREQDTKEYVSVSGDEGFLTQVSKLMLPKLTYGDEIAGIQTVGGSGAVRMVLECLARLGTERTLWLSSPTWPNHKGIAAATGYETRTFQYVDDKMQIDVERIIADLADAKSGDVILMHLCCHNPTGVDPTEEQLQALFEAFREKGLFPVVDAAYVGFGDELENDVAKFQRYVDAFPEVTFAISFSKNFGIYRERTGCAFLCGHDGSALKRALESMFAIARAGYSMPPDHGSRIVRTILESKALDTEWRAELSAVRNRIRGTRQELARQLSEKAPRFDWSYLRDGMGMFSLLPLTVEGVEQMKADDAIYVMPSGRINIAGLAASRLDGVVDSIARNLPG